MAAHLCTHIMLVAIKNTHKHTQTHSQLVLIYEYYLILLYRHWYVSFIWSSMSRLIHNTWYSSTHFSSAWNNDKYVLFCYQVIILDSSKVFCCALVKAYFNNILIIFILRNKVTGLLQKPPSFPTLVKNIPNLLLIRYKTWLYSTNVVISKIICQRMWILYVGLPD